MGLLDGITSTFTRSLTATKNSVIGQIKSLAPSFSPGRMNYQIENTLAGAEARIMQAVMAKLQGQGILGAEARVLAALQSQVDAAVSALVDATPSLNLPALNVNANPVALAGIGTSLAAMKARIIAQVMAQLAPNPAVLQGMVQRATNNMSAMVSAALESKLNTYSVTLDVEGALAQQIDALIDPLVDEIVATIRALPNIQIQL